MTHYKFMSMTPLVTGLIHAVFFSCNYPPLMQMHLDDPLIGVKLAPGVTMTLVPSSG